MTTRVHIRVISLPDSSRREAMREQLDRIGRPWAFFDALRTAPDDIPYDAARARRRHGRPLTAGELGCFASHRALWRFAAALPPDEMALVLEDDLLIDPRFFADIEAAGAAARRYGYLRLYGKVPAGLRLEGPFLNRHLARSSGRVYGTQAYLLGPEAARRLLRSVAEVVRPVDNEIDRFWAHGLPSRMVFPYPVMEIGAGSTIEAARRARPSPPALERVTWTLHRSVEKMRRHASDLVARLRLGVLGAAEVGSRLAPDPDVDQDRV